MYTEGDDDRDWRYHRDAQTEHDIPGLLRLQHPEIFTPTVATPNCLPCPPCADCSREGTATIASGWGLGQTSQQFYRGLLKGAVNEFKTLPNRPGSAALGPVLIQETVPVWDEQFNLRPKIQFKSQDCIGDDCFKPDTSSQCSFKDDREDLPESDQDCPESHYNDQSRDEWSDEMTPVKDESMFRWQFMVPFFLVITAIVYYARSFIGPRRTIVGWVVFVVVFYGVLYPAARILHKQDLDEATAAQTAWRAGKSSQLFGNATCGIRWCDFCCVFSRDIFCVLRSFSLIFARVWTACTPQTSIRQRPGLRTRWQRTAVCPSAGLLATKRCSDAPLSHCALQRRSTLTMACTHSGPA